MVRQAHHERKARLGTNGRWLTTNGRWLTTNGFRARTDQRQGTHAVGASHSLVRAAEVSIGGEQRCSAFPVALIA